MKFLFFRLVGCGLLLAVTSEIHVQGGPSLFPKSIGIPFANPETNAPFVSIDYPTNHQQVGESVIQTLITATDDTRVEAFLFSLNGNDQAWSWAPGMQWPWGESIVLNPGVNTFEVVCADYWGNQSSTSVTFEYVPNVPKENVPNNSLALNIGNGGQVNPNYQGQVLTPGQTYSMTARPAKGFRFEGWSGSQTKTKPKLTFVMQPNLSFTARFKDVKRPLDIITFRRANATAKSGTIITTGKAADNSSVTNVYYQLNDGAWETATTTNAWKNWETAALSPVTGRNVIRSYAVDDSGLASRTNRVRFNY
jgi:uncharacterized repeat protein (TIGR02543 family)